MEALNSQVAQMVIYSFFQIKFKLRHNSDCFLKNCFWQKGAAVTREQCRFSMNLSIHLLDLDLTAVLLTTISRAVPAMEMEWLIWETLQTSGNIIYLLTLDDTDKIYHLFIL
jgi:hypothetical protein